MIKKILPALVHHPRICEVTIFNPMTPFLSICVGKLLSGEQMNLSRPTLVNLNQQFLVRIAASEVLPASK
jgi:hypothetical protein